MTETTEERCGTCRFWVERYCHRYPPVFVPGRTIEQIGFSHVGGSYARGSYAGGAEGAVDLPPGQYMPTSSRIPDGATWPPTHASNWCGEWKAHVS